MADQTTNSGGNTSQTSNQSAPNQGADSDMKLLLLNEMIANVLTSRQEFFRQLMDPRRDIEEECGYPSLTGPVNQETYQQLYNRDAIAARVVELYPRECWQVQPRVYEDDSSEISTEFEKAWDDVGSTLRGESSYFKAKQGNPVWDYLKRIDELSGIGQFGILLLGIDDGLPLSAPVAGVEVDDSIGPFATGMPSGIGSSTLVNPPTSPNSSSSPPNQEGLPKREEDTTITSTPNPAQTTFPMSGDPATGTDAQYFQTGSLVPVGAKSAQASKGKRKLLFLRAYPESMVQIIQYESRYTSPRFGQPIRYLVTMNDPRQGQTGVGLPIATVEVHWSRVIHVADIHHQASNSEVFAIPRMQPVLNNILGLRKLYCGSPEMFWKGAFPGMSLETQPTLGGDVKVDIPALRDMWEQYSNGLQRALFLMGMSAKTLAPTVSDPTGQIEVQLNAICIKKGCPVRIFKGSERGELASSQDDQAWNDRLKERQEDYITPRIIVPLIDRLIAIGILPKPKVKKPVPQGEEPFALKPQQPPQPTHAIGPDGTPMPLVGGGNGPPGKPGGGFGKPPFPPKPGATPLGLAKPKVPGAKPAFPPSPSLNRGGLSQSSRSRVWNAFPPTKRPIDDGTSQDTETPTGDGEDPTQTIDSKDTTTPLDGMGETGDEDTPDISEMDVLGISPEAMEPEKPGYYVEWPDLTSQSDSEKATIAGTLITALAEYISGGVDELIPPLELLTKIFKFDEDTAHAIIEAARKAQEQATKEQEAMQGPPPNGMGESSKIDPETGEPIPGQEGDTGVDSNGNPISQDGTDQEEGTTAQDQAFSNLGKDATQPPNKRPIPPFMRK